MIKYNIIILIIYRYKYQDSKRIKIYFMKYNFKFLEKLFLLKEMLNLVIISWEFFPKEIPDQESKISGILYR